jgi:hypothetical protein
MWIVLTLVWLYYYVMQLGTLTSDIAGQLKELRQGRIEFKMESKSILHVGLGKVLLCFLPTSCRFPYNGCVAQYILMSLR